MNDMDADMNRLTVDGTPFIIFHTDEVCLLKQLVEKFVEADRKNRLYGR